MTNESKPAEWRAKRLYKDPIDKKIGGVASGVAKYFDIDVALVRAVWAVSILVGGFGFILYLVLWFILDDDPDAFADPIPARMVEPVMADPPTEAEQAPDVAEDEIEAETVDSDVDEPAAEV